MSEPACRRYQGEEGLVAEGKMLPLNPWGGARAGARIHFGKHNPHNLPSSLNTLFQAVCIQLCSCLLVCYI